MILDVEFSEIESVLDVEFSDTTVIEPKIEPLRVTQNGEYNATDGVDGYNPVIVDIVGGDTEEYTGSYEIVPTLNKQTLSTAHKVMRHDVTVDEIPITTVSNSSGGNTVIIGG